MYKSRPRYSQNFLYNRELISRLIGQSSIGQKDLVIEIGPGKGIITKELAKVAKHVLTVEIDTHLVKALITKKPQQENVSIFAGNFLDFPLPASSFKVFANLPFALEGKIIRKLLDHDYPSLEELQVVVRKEPGLRWIGYKKESKFSLSHKPWYQMNLVYSFRRSDFTPKPKIDAVMIQAKKREVPLVPCAEKALYIKYLDMIFGSRATVFKNLKPNISSHFLSKQHHTYNLLINPTNLSLEKAVSLYKSLKQELQIG